MRAMFEWTGASADFGRARELTDRGARVQAHICRPTYTGLADDWLLFEGCLTACRIEFDGSGRRILLDAIDGVTHRHGGRLVVGQWSLTADGSVRHVPDLPATFNANGRPSRSRTQAVVNGRRTWLFEHREEQADFWSLADAINYVLAIHLAGDRRILLPPTERIEALCGDVRPAGAAVTGLGGLDALAELARLGGLAFAIETRSSVRGRSGWRMRWFSDHGGRRVVLRHQRSGERFHSAGTNVAAGSLRFDHDDARHVWAALGELERVESTFALVAAWDPSLEAADHRMFSLANSDFHQVRDVYRRWSLNEAGDWSGEPFNRGPAADLSAVLDGGATLLRRRRLLPCLSRDASGQSAGVLVEVSYDSGTTWQRYGGRIETLTDEAGVRIADGDLPPDYWQAARAGTLAVRVTASIESDRRVRVEFEDPLRADGRRTVEHLRWMGGRFRRQWVDANSRLADAGNADVTDDRPAMTELLRQEMQRAKTAATNGRLVLPWLSTLYAAGDRAGGIAGQALRFGESGGDREPLVRTVRHQLGDRWQTVLELGGA